MTALDSLLASTLADPLAISRKVAAPIGYVGFDLPLELLLCGTRHFSHLPWRTGQQTAKADHWLESSFAPWARSILQDWFEGAFDHFDSVVFTRGDDSAQRLYYYICELQRRGQLAGPQALILDISLIPRASSIVNNRRTLATLLDHLDINVDALENGRQRANEHRSRFAHIDQERTGPGHRYERIARASLFTDLMPVLSTLTTADAPSRKVLLAGSSPADDRFHLAIEAAGWNVTGDSYHRALRRFGKAITTEGNPLDAIAHHMNDAPLGPRTFGDRSAALLEDYRRARASTVILWLAEEDESLAWTVARQRQTLNDHGIPSLVLTRRRWDGNDDAADAMQHFLREHS